MPCHTGVTLRAGMLPRSVKLGGCWLVMLLTPLALPEHVLEAELVLWGHGASDEVPVGQTAVPVDEADPAEITEERVGIAPPSDQHRERPAADILDQPGTRGLFDAPGVEEVADEIGMLDGGPWIGNREACRQLQHQGMAVAVDRRLHPLADRGGCSGPGRGRGLDPHPAGT